MERLKWITRLLKHLLLKQADDSFLSMSLMTSIIGSRGDVGNQAALSYM